VDGDQPEVVITHQGV
jgi:hypothetical protein